MGAFHRSACWTWFDRGYHYHSKKLQISTDVEKEKGRSVDQAWFYTRDGHIWNSRMWLAKRSRWLWGKPASSREAKFTSIYRFVTMQFMTRFSLHSVDAIAKWVSVELFMVKRLRKWLNSNDIFVENTKDCLGNNSTSGKNSSMENHWSREMRTYLSADVALIRFTEDY